MTGFGEVLGDRGKTVMGGGAATGTGPMGSRFWDKPAVQASPTEWQLSPDSVVR